MFVTSLYIAASVLEKLLEKRLTTADVRIVPLNDIEVMHVIVL